MNKNIFTILLVFCLTVVNANGKSGMCGDNLMWSLQNGNLNISGVGAMYDYSSTNNAPWYSYRDNITSVSMNILEPNVRIGTCAFYNCINLASVSMPNCMTTIADSAFFNCATIATISLPNDLTYIGEAVFSNCNSLQSISIPNGVHSIKNATFEGCSNLSTVLLPNNVSVIGVSAFENCTNLVSITIPISVINIYPYAFRGCSNLSQLYIPKNVCSIGLDAFAGCGKLNSIFVSENNQWYNSRDNCNALIDTHEQSLIRGCKNTIIPDGIIKIEQHAFSECTALTSITIPNSVTRIGNAAFEGCNSLSSINIPNGVTYLGHLAFRGCKNIRTIHIPESVTNLGNSVFVDCSGLSSISVSNSNTKYNSRNNCNAIIETSSNTLLVGCKSTIIPNDVLKIGTYAFSGCLALAQISIPNSVTLIERGAFENCQMLSSIVFGYGLNTIESKAFLNCLNLDTITCNSINPPSVIVSEEEPSFSPGLSPAMIVLVPTRSINQYKAHVFWGKFDVRSISDLSAVDVIMEEESAMKLLHDSSTQIFTLQGNVVNDRRDNLPAGVYILCNDDKIQKIYLK